MNGESSTKLQLNGSGVLRFQGFLLDLDRGELQVEGQVVPLRPKTYAVMALLTQNAGRLLSKASLIDAVWPDVVVGEDSLVQCVGELRIALGANGVALIKNVPRRGYLLDAIAMTSAADFQNSDDPRKNNARRAKDQADAAAPAAVSPAHGPMPEVAPPHGKPVARRKLWLAFPIAALLVFCVLAWRAGPFSTAQHIDRDMAARKSVAILPFADLSETPAPWLAEAVMRDLITDIARVPDLLVINGFGSAGAAKPPVDLREAGRQLGAQHLLVGSVRRAGAAVTVTAQLVAAGSGAVLWSEHFDYPALDDWNWKRDISPRVARAMDLRMIDAAANTRRNSGKTLDAVDHAMAGWYLLTHQSIREDLWRARAHFEDAFKTDPESVYAIVGWAVSHRAEVVRRWSTDPNGQLALADQAINKALKLDPNYPMAHVARADVLSHRGKFEEATQAYETALRMNPSDAYSLSRLGWLKLQTGHAAETVDIQERALRLSPLEHTIIRNGHFFAGMAEFHLGHDDIAYERMRKTLAQDPKFGFAWQWMAAIDALHGRPESAATNLAEFRRLIPNHTVSSLRATEMSRNETFWVAENRFYEGLRKAGLPE